MKKVYTSLAIICLIFGIMVAAQYKSNRSNPTYFSPDRWAEVAIQTQQLKNQHDALTNEIVSLNYKLSSTDTSAQVKAIEDMLTKANITSGTIPVTGPGIVVFLEEPQDPLQGYVNPVINYWYILPIVNELHAAGAEAVSINGERITATSAITQQGSTILINQHPITSPIEIKAIGNAKILESSLNLKGGVMQALLSSGAKAEINGTEEVDIPANRQQFFFKYAQPGQDS